MPDIDIDMDININIQPVKVQAIIRAVAEHLGNPGVGCCGGGEATTPKPICTFCGVCSWDDRHEDACVVITARAIREREKTYA
jgi:hypothetical protein